MSVDHRRLQRTLFRMQHDERFVARLRAADPEALASTGLGEADLARLLALPSTGVDADAGGKRRAQFLRNVSSEFALTAAWAGCSGLDTALVASFPQSTAFHACIAADGRLPLAFAEHARARCASAATASRNSEAAALLESLLLLETCMAHARRHEWTRARPQEGELVLSPRAELVLVPSDTLAAAGVLRTALDAGTALPAQLHVGQDDLEHVLVLAEASASPHVLAAISVELLSPLAGGFLVAARHPLADAQLASFALARDAEPDELRAFAASLLADGVLVQAPSTTSPSSPRAARDGAGFPCEDG